MAIAFNLPSEREASEENFSRLNRLLAELYEVLCHILVSRQPGQEAPAHDARRDAARPYHSESDADRPQPEPQCRLSASSPPLSLTFEELEDDVFISPRTDNGNDLFSTRNVEIFGYRSPRTPAGVLLSPRRDRTFTFPETSEKHWRDKGGTDMADGVGDADVTDAASPEGQTADSSDGSLLSSIIPDKLSAGSICTAVLLMLGWRFLSKR